MSLFIASTPEERKQLERMANSRSLPHGLVQRADILVRSLNGAGVPEIVRAMRLNEATVRKWLHRFQREGFTGLNEAPGRGRPRRITPEQRLALKAMARTPCPTGRRWTLRSLCADARAAGITISPSQLRRILQED